MHAQYAPPNAEWNKPVEPFRIAGNVHFVGAEGISSFLVTTPGGHILIDTGFEETVPIVEAGVRKLGFRMEDIRIILVTHSHYDHSGGVATMKRKTGARLLTNPREVERFAAGGRNDFAFADRFAFPPVEVDGVLRDGEPVTLGGVAVTPHFTPGHTKGGTSYTIEAEDGGRRLRVVIACSVSAPGYKLVGNEKYPSLVSDLEGSITKLRSLPCDVFLGGHGWEFGLLEKARAKREGAAGNPFVDPAGYRAWLDRAETALRTELEKQKREALSKRASP